MNLYCFVTKSSKLTMLKIKKQSEMTKALDQFNFYIEVMEDCHIEDIANYMKIHDGLEMFFTVVKHTKMSHYTLTKTVLVLFSLIQVDKTLQEKSILPEFIEYLLEKAKQIAQRPLNSEKKRKRSTSPHGILQKFGKMFNGKKHNKGSGIDQTECNSGNYWVNHVIIPLLGIISRIKTNFDYVYRPNGQLNSEKCWATLNFLHKFGQFEKSFQEIGRYYYTDLVGFVFQTLKVIDFDIRVLYRRVVFYLRKNIERIEKSIMEGKHNSLTIEQNEQIKQILLIVGEVDKLNDDLRVIYIGKYFARKFYERGIRMPVLFRGEQIVDLFDDLSRSQEKKFQKKQRKSSTSTVTFDTMNTSRSPKSDKSEVEDDAYQRENQILA